MIVFSGKLRKVLEQWIDVIRSLLSEILCGVEQKRERGRYTVWRELL